MRTSTFHMIKKFVIYSSGRLENGSRLRNDDINETSSKEESVCLWLSGVETLIEIT